MTKKTQVEYGNIVTSDTTASGTVLIDEFCLRLFMHNLAMRNEWHRSEQIKTPEWCLMPHVKLNTHT
jgi:hypothetical protein